MMIARTRVWVAGCALAFFAGGCSDEEQTPAERAQELTAPVRAAISNPSGKLSAGTAPDVFRALANGDAVGGAMAFAGGMGGPQPSPQDFGGSACIESGGADDPVTIDLACASGGELTGVIVMRTEVAEGATYMLLEYQSVCSTEAAVCIDGDAGVEMRGQPPSDYSMIMAGDFTITEDGESRDFQYGFEMEVSGGGSDITWSWVVFVDGESYVVSMTTSDDGTTGTWSVRGANGTWECSYTDGGAAGTCTDGEGDTFSW
jgi:hypothetical protein